MMISLAVQKQDTSADAWFQVPRVDHLLIHKIRQSISTIHMIKMRQERKRVPGDKQRQCRAAETKPAGGQVACDSQDKEPGS